jgi:hypothetical protein
MDFGGVPDACSFRAYTIAQPPHPATSISSLHNERQCQMHRWETAEAELFNLMFVLIKRPRSQHLPSVQLLQEQLSDSSLSSCFLRFPRPLHSLLVPPTSRPRRYIKIMSAINFTALSTEVAPSWVNDPGGRGTWVGFANLS